MAVFTIKNKEYNIHEDTVLSNSQMDEICDNIIDVKMMIDIAYIQRHNYKVARRLYDLATLSNPDDENIQIQIIGLMVQHNMDIRANLFTSKDKRLDYLKGIFFMKNKQYEDAEFCFETAGYSKGLEICSVLKNDREKMTKSTDPIVKAYSSSKYWDSTKCEVTNKDFLYTIGKSDKFDNENDFDVQLTKITKSLDNALKANDLIALDSIVNDMLSLEKVSGKPSVYLFYLIGKVYHIKNHLTKALEWYNKALSIEVDYAPALFNICRINGVVFDTSIKNTDIADFNALINLRNAVFNLDLINCSDKIRNLARITVHANKLDCEIIHELNENRKYFNELAVTNNLCVLYHLKDKSQNIYIKELENIIETIDSSLKEYVTYNIGVINKDVKLLNEVGFPEAKLQIDYLNNDINTPDTNLKISIMNKQGLLDVNSPLLQDDVYGKIIKGNLLLKEYKMKPDQSILEKAASLFMSVSNSQYCINGLGICAVINGNTKAAIKLFKQIVDINKDAMKNLGNCYILNKDYKKTIECYSKIQDRITETDKKILLALGQQCKSIKCLEALIKLGITSLKTYLALCLIEKGEMEKAKELGIDSQEIKKKLEESINKEAERKRKVEEIEEYRKRQRTG